MLPKEEEIDAAQFNKNNSTDTKHNDSCDQNKEITYLISQDCTAVLEHTTHPNHSATAKAQLSI